MDEGSDAGHKQKPNAGQRIEQEAHIGLKWSRLPVAHDKDHWRPGVPARLDGRDARCSIAVPSQV